MFKNVASQSVTLYAVDASTGLPKAGDSANMVFYVSKDDGAVTAIAASSGVPTESDATNAKGDYKIAVSQTETNADKLRFTGKSSTSNIVVVPQTIYTVPANFTKSVIDSAGLHDANTVKVGPTGAGTAQTARDLGLSVLLASGQKVDVDTIKTNPVVNAGTITFPTGATLASTTNITAGTITTVTTTTTATNLTNAPTSGDFTATMKTSIGTAVAASAVSSVTGNVGGDVTGKVLGGGASAFTAVGVQADLQTVKTQTVTCAAGVTVNAVVGTATAGSTATALATAQTGITTLVTGVTLNANQHVIVDSGTVTTLTNLPPAPTDWLTAAAVKADAVTKIQSGLSTYAGGDTGGTTTLLTRLPSAITLTAGAVTVGANNDKSGYSLSANQHVIVDSGTVTTLTNLPTAPTDWVSAASVSAAAVTKIQSGLSTYGGGDTAGTTTLLTRMPGTVLLASDYTAPPSAATVATAVGTQVTSDHGNGSYVRNTEPVDVSTAVNAIKAKTDHLPNNDIVHTLGKLWVLDGSGNPVMAAASYTAPDNSSVGAIKVKTDNLPASPAAVGDIPTVTQIATGVVGFVIGNGRTVSYFLQGGSNKIAFAADGLSYTVYHTDDSSVLYAGSSLRFDADVGGLKAVDPA